MKIITSRVKCQWAGGGSGRTPSNPDGTEGLGLGGTDTLEPPTEGNASTLAGLLAGGGVVPVSGKSWMAGAGAWASCSRKLTNSSPKGADGVPEALWGAGGGVNRLERNPRLCSPIYRG